MFLLRVFLALPGWIEAHHELQALGPEKGLVVIHWQRQCSSLLTCGSKLTLTGWVIRKSTMVSVIFISINSIISRSGSLAVSRYPEHRTRDSRERSLDRRPGRSPSRYSGADCYRPLSSSHRGPYPFARADCYRPRYDDDRNATRTQETSGTVESHGRDSHSHLTRSSPAHGRQLSSQGKSTPRSISSRSRSRTPGFRPRTSISCRETSRERRIFKDFDERPPKRIKLRSPSRSSIASSRASDNQQIVIEHGPSNQPQGSYLTPVDPTNFSALVEDNKLILNGSESKPKPMSRSQEPDVAPMKGAPSDFCADRSEASIKNTARKSSNKLVSPTPVASMYSL
jgi:hypothetical protein